MIPLEAQLNVVIIGAGLGGLAAAISIALAGHQVTVLESARELAEVGAGLQILPNASRLLKHWKVPQSVWNAGAVPNTLTVHRYSGQVLAHEPDFKLDMETKYEAPFVDLHRVDLQQGLYARAVELGVKVVLNERLESIDFSGPIVKTFAGTTYQCDLVVGADGLWSKSRELLIGKKDDPKPTGDLAYRVVLSLDQVQDEELRAWIQNPSVHFWIGPGAHAVGYSLRGGKMHNIVLLVPDDLPPNVARQAGSLDEMQQLFEGWDPILRRFLSQVDKVDKWKLMHRAELPSWINKESNLVLLGDSCHPMLPYLAMGSCSALEDAAVLGDLLGQIRSKKDVPEALRVYEKLRKSRGEAIVEETFKQRHDFHMPDGPEQEERDTLFLSQLGKPLKGAFPSRWTCPEVQPWLYGYDALKEAAGALAASKGEPGVEVARPIQVLT